MKWEIQYSERADKFIKKQKIEKEIKSILTKFIAKYTGQSINLNVDVKKLKGQWDGYHRIRLNKIRIIIKVIKSDNSIIVDAIDFRKDAYRMG